QGLSGAGSVAQELSGAGSVGQEPSGSGSVGQDPGDTPVEFDVLARFAPQGLYGRVAAVGDLIPRGSQPRSNLDPLPSSRVRERLERGMAALLGPKPWRSLFSSADTVAIKINGLASGHLSPRKELVWAIVEGLRSAGVSDGRIIIWERTTRELQRSGFPLQTSAAGVRAYGTDALRGGGYAATFETFGSVGSLVSRIVSNYATALINVGVLKDHDLAGLSAGMKNLYGLIHNPNRYHDNACDPFVAEVAALPSVRRTLRLTVVDATIAQAQGGPAYVPEWIWPCNRILLGLDPVACDRVAWDTIEKERAGRGLPSLTEAKREPTWIQTAAGYGLGRAEDIDLREV
ncbi:MAG: DUF362 domain-containing protein, partial [Candidatus Eisenbacteria sp.]|nr:DUF362 domain-containing protein [Candidatus Eisenbacteria bacterium]